MSPLLLRRRLLVACRCAGTRCTDPEMCVSPHTRKQKAKGSMWSFFFFCLGPLAEAPLLLIAPLSSCHLLPPSSLAPSFPLSLPPLPIPVPPPPGSRYIIPLLGRAVALRRHRHGNSGTTAGRPRLLRGGRGHPPPHGWAFDLGRVHRTQRDTGRQCRQDRGGRD